MAEERKSSGIMLLLRLSNNCFVVHKNMISIFLWNSAACVCVRVFVFVVISKKQVQLHIFPPTNHGPWDVVCSNFPNLFISRQTGGHPSI